MLEDNDKKKKFQLGPDYKVELVLGEGAYGIVCAARHLPTNRRVAVKKIAPLQHEMFALRTLREIRILRYLSHENVVGVLDVLGPASFETFRDVYVVQELMETDMHRVIRSQALQDEHCRYFVYQILRGLKYIHSANLIHRDLKPSNILLDTNCDLKICDFGLSRVVNNATDMDPGYMTEYVATRWYRAPEIMLTFKEYTQAIDIWSVGCIFSEMLTGRPLFPGANYVDQLSLIFGFLGTPSEADCTGITSARTQEYVRSLPVCPGQSIAGTHPRGVPGAIDFLTRLLAFNPRKRPSVEQALGHPYLSMYHDPLDEPVAPPIPAHLFEFDDARAPPDIHALKKMLYDEIMMPLDVCHTTYANGRSAHEYACTPGRSSRML